MQFEESPRFTIATVMKMGLTYVFAQIQTLSLGKHG